MTKVFMDTIDELLTRGVEKIYPSKEELEKVLRSGKKLRLYLGVDPTGEKLHIGHMVGLRKLRQFRELGHHVILLLGDFTGMIGDPSDKMATRKKLTREEVLANVETYKEQASKILKFDGENPIEIKFNSEWLSKLTFADVIELAGNFTVQQMIERDMFQKRIKEGKLISLHEFLYPLMVAYDCVVLNVDLEVGGSDQTFNMLGGRNLMKKMKNKEKFVLTWPLLTDSNGVKIGKTEGNVIALTAKPNDLYGMIMNLGDDVIVKCFEYLTEMPMEEVKNIAKKIDAGENPMVHKKKLAYLLTSVLNDEKAAKLAQEEFELVHQKGENPIYDISIYHIRSADENIIDVLVNSKLVTSRSEAKRLVEQKAVEINGKTWNTQDGTGNIKIDDGSIIKVGKNRFIKIEIK